MQKRIFIATTLILFATNAMAANIYDHYVGNTKTGLWEEVAVPNAYDFTHFRSSSQLGAEGEFTFNFDQANKSMCSNWQYDLKLHFLKADNNIKDTMKVTVHYADGAAILFVNAWADDPEPSFRSYQNLGYFAGVTAVAISNLSVQQTSDNSVIKYAIADVLQYNPVNTNEECIPMVPSDTSTGNVDSIPPDTIPKLPMGINVSSSRTISSHQGGFNFDLSKDANFGQLIAALGDADNNGVNEFAVSSRHFDIDKGFTSIFILVPDAQGNITDYKELNIVTTLGKGFDGHYPIQAIKSIGDFDANGTSDLLVNQFANDNGLGNTGKMIILLFDNNYKVIDTITISNSQNNLSFLMPRGASIGMNLDSLWDIDGNGVTDFFATTSGLSSPNPWLAILMNRDGSVASEIKINSPTSYSNIASVIGDVDGDGVKDIVSKHIDSSKVYITLINDNFSIKENYEVNLGLSLSINGFNALGDIDDNGAIDFMISGSNIGSGGVRLDDGVFIVSMNTNRTVKNISIIDYTDLPGATYDIRSSAPQAMDIDNDGKLELLIGDRNYSNSTSNSGAIHIVDLTASP